MHFRQNAEANAVIGDVDDKPYLCYVCNQASFTRLDSLNNHIAARHPDEKPVKLQTYNPLPDSSTPAILTTILKV